MSKIDFDKLLPPPWKENPLAVFGFTLETVRSVQDRPQVLAQMARITKRALMLAHHADHTGSEGKAQALNDAQTYLEDPYWQRTIVKEFLQHEGSANYRTRKRLKELEETIAVLAQELDELQTGGHGSPILQQAPNGKVVSGASHPLWVASALHLNGKAPDYVRDHALLPHVLPALVVVKEMGKSGAMHLYFVEEEFGSVIKVADCSRSSATSPTQLLTDFVAKELKALVPKPEQIERYLTMLRTGIRELGRWKEYLEQGEYFRLQQLRRRVWWPQLDELAFAELMYASCKDARPEDVRAYGELEAQKLLSKKLDLIPGRTIGPKTKEHMETLVLPALIQSFLSRIEEVGRGGSGQRFLFGTAERRRLTLKRLRARLRPVRTGDMIALGSLPLADYQSVKKWSAYKGSGIAVDTVSAAFPTLRPTLTTDHVLVQHSWAMTFGRVPGASPYVKLAPLGQIQAVQRIDDELLTSLEVRLCPA